MTDLSASLVLFVKARSTVLVPVPKYIYSLSVSLKHFTIQYKQSLIVPVYKKDRKASAQNYRPMSLLRDLSNVFGLVMHDNLTYYFKCKLIPSQHGFL